MRKKSVLFAGLLLLAVLAFTGCGSSGNQKTADMKELCEAMSAADDSLPDMTTVYGTDEDAEELFTYLSDLDYDKVDDYFLTYSTEGKADEIAVIAVKNSKDAYDAQKTLNAQVEDRKKTFDTYDPTQVERVEKAVVFTKDQYAVLIISDNASAVKDAFMAAVE